MVASDSCGPIFLAIPKYSQLTGTYTPTTTDIYTVEIYNERTAVHQDLLENYIDNISLVPQTADLSSDVIQFSISTSNRATLSLDAGPTWAGWRYLVLLSTAGNWPGFTNNGVWVPLMMNGTFWYSANNPNSAMLVHTNWILDSNGQEQAAINLPNPMGSPWLGKTINVAYILYQGPNYVPISYASMPVSIYFIS